MARPSTNLTARRSSESEHGSTLDQPHGATLSAARIPALVESATRIALPTPLAPGILDLASMLSRWRSVSESPAAVPGFRAGPLQAAHNAKMKSTQRFMGPF